MQEPKLKIETRKGPWRSARPLYRSKNPTPKIININLLLKITPRQPTLLHPKACRISFKFVQSTERPQRTHKNSKYTESKSLIINHELKYMTGGTLSAPFWCLCQKLSLSPLYFNKTLLHKSSERSSLVSGPGLNSSLGAKNPGVFAWFNNNLSSWGLVRDPSGQGKDAWSFSSLFS